jgi:hypothetical protein
MIVDFSVGRQMPLEQPSPGGDVLVLRRLVVVERGGRRNSSEVERNTLERTEGHARRDRSPWFGKRSIDAVRQHDAVLLGELNFTPRQGILVGAASG